MAMTLIYFWFCGFTIHLLCYLHIDMHEHIFGWTLKKPCGWSWAARSHNIERQAVAKAVL